MFEHSKDTAAGSPDNVNIVSYRRVRRAPCRVLQEGSLPMCCRQAGASTTNVWGMINNTLGADPLPCTGVPQVRHAKLSYGIDASPVTAVAPLQTLRSFAYVSVTTPSDYACWMQLLSWSALVCVWRGVYGDVVCAIRVSHVGATFVVSAWWRNVLRPSCFFVFVFVVPPSPLVA